MSDFKNFIGSGFKDSRPQIGNTLTKGATSKTVIATAIANSKISTGSGYMVEADSVCDVLVADFTSLALVQHENVTLDGTACRIVQIDTDVIDGAYKVYLKINR